jgi:2-succinyl-6-hydroxy-2,4-cyclohexadiene-1-carboxylate synthase
MNAIQSRFVDASGVRIHAEIVPCAESAAPPVVVLHGFTGSAEGMRGVVAELCQTRTTICVDLVGHGCSDAPDDVKEYSMERCVSQIASVVDALEFERPHLLGYSMGGRAALAFCAAHPGRTRSALLVGASGGLADPTARANRIREDEALADRILSAGLEKFVDEWMAKSIFASQERLGDAMLLRLRDERMRNRPHGLALSLRGMGTGAMAPVDLEELNVPTCFVAGAEDPKFCEVARAYGERLPNSRYEIVPTAGHAVHLENPKDFGRVARTFFGRVDAGNI